MATRAAYPAAGTVMGTPVLSRMQQKPSRGGSFDEDEEEGLSRFGCLESSAA